MKKEKTYTLLSHDDFNAEENDKLYHLADEAEHGYDDSVLAHAQERTPGRPLEVGKTPARKIIKIRLDLERENRLNQYALTHHLTTSQAIRQLIDQYA